jgi:hypothetical protein
LSELIATEENTSSGDSSWDTGNLPLSSVPILSSNSSAQAKLYLNFNGRYDATWGSWSNITTPAYDRDGDPTSFSASELTSIQEIWARVAEDFAAFNIDVTTVDPGSLSNKVIAHIAIGGNGSWYGSAGGVAYIGGFYNSASNVGFVFDDNLGNGFAKYVADAASHEAGHLFGLNHQSLYSGTSKTQEYYSGNSAWAPLMGNSYSATRSTWHNGASSISSTSYQDELSILANANNGFGLKADDFGSTIASASALAISGGSVNFAGLLNHQDDADVWQFSTTGGSVSFSLSVAQFGANLDATLELRDADGNLVASASPSNSLNASVSATLAVGSYFVVARSDGTYGNMGQYTIVGTVPQAAVPEISVLVSGVGLSSGATTEFGSVSLGGTVQETFTVQNSGSGTLSLSLIDPASLGTGFTLVSNLTDTQLAAGESTTFVIGFTPTVPGSLFSSLSILSDDADEGTYVVSLSGTAQTSSWGTVAFFLASGRHTSGDEWYSATAGQTGIFTAEAYFSQVGGNVDIAIYNASNQLLANSTSAGDAERVDVSVVAGEQLFIHVTGTNASVTFRCTNLVSAAGDTIYVAGTSSDDLYVFLPGSTSHRVAINGVGYDFDATSFINAEFQDPGGVDTLVVIGTSQNEVAVVSQTSTTLSSASYGFVATGTEHGILQAGEGNDSATFFDRVGNDTFIGSPQQGTLYGAGYSANVFGFDDVQTTFNAGGFDQAFLYGSISDDRFEASPTTALLSSSKFQLRTSGYDTVVAVGGWGNDLALLSGSAGDEVFIGDQDAGSLSGSIFYLRAANFDRVEARSSGGLDAAYLWDSVGDDYLGASRVLAFFNGLGFSNYVESFDRVTAISRSGNDTADLYDSSGDDRVVISRRSRGMEANDYLVQTENFRTFRAYASIGYDTVSIQQLLSTDSLRGRKNWLTVSNGDAATIYGFDSGSAVAGTGQKPNLDLLAIDYLFSKSGW